VGTEVEIVCGMTRRYSVDPKTACLRKARDKLARCPGCNEDHIVPGTICRACKAAIDKINDTPADTAATWYSLDPSILGHVDAVGLVGYFSPYGREGEAYKDKGVAVLRCLGRLAAAKGPRRFLEEGYGPETYNVHWGQRAVRLKVPTTGYGSNDALPEEPKVELDDDQLAALRELGDLLAPWARAHYLRGVEEGRRVLAATADGTLTFTNFEEPTIRLAKQRQAWGMKEEADGDEEEHDDEDGREGEDDEDQVVDEDGEVADEDSDEEEAEADDEANPEDAD
jgi:hypothetical protein